MFWEQAETTFLKFPGKSPLIPDNLQRLLFKFLVEDLG